MSLITIQVRESIRSPLVRAFKVATAGISPSLSRDSLALCKDDSEDGARYMAAGQVGRCIAESLFEVPGVRLVILCGSRKGEVQVVAEKCNWENVRGAVMNGIRQGYAKQAGLSPDAIIVVVEHEVAHSEQMVRNELDPMPVFD